MGNPVTPVRKRALALGVIVAVGGALALTGTSGASVSTVSGDAYDVSVNLTTFPGTGFQGTITAGPLPSVTLPSTGGGPFTASAADVNQPGILVASILPVSTEGATGENGFAESSAALANVNALGGALTATAISSECRSDSSGSTGSSTLLNAVIGLAGAPTVDASPAPNTTIGPILGITIILNEQIESEQPGSSSITVNAVHIIVDNFALRGDIILGHVHCDVAGPNVNQPTTTTAAPTTSSTTTTTVAPTTTTTSSTTTTTVAPTTTTSSTTTTTVAPTTTTKAPKPKCNAGKGNGSEILPNGQECDPGNSGGHNKAGD